MENGIKSPKEWMDEGENFERVGEFKNALDCFSRALDVLVVAARTYAEKSEPAVLDAVVGKGIISEQYLMKFNEYLKKDMTGAILSNHMGMVFAKMGNKASAKAFFEQSIDLTPGGAIYDDPHIGIEMLKNL